MAKYKLDLIPINPIARDLTPLFNHLQNPPARLLGVTRGIRLFSEPAIIPPIRGADPGREASPRRYLQIQIKPEIAAGLLSLLPYLGSVAKRYYLIQLWPGKESRALEEFR